MKKTAWGRGETATPDPGQLSIRCQAPAYVRSESCRQGWNQNLPAPSLAQCSLQPLNAPPPQLPGNLPDQEVEQRLRLSPCKQRSRACWMRSSVHVVAPCCILSHRLRGRQTLVSLETPRLEEYKAEQGSHWRQRALTAPGRQSAASRAGLAPGCAAQRGKTGSLGHPTAQAREVRGWGRRGVERCGPHR